MVQLTGANRKASKGSLSGCHQGGTCPILGHVRIKYPFSEDALGQFRVRLKTSDQKTEETKTKHGALSYLVID